MVRNKDCLRMNLKYEICKWHSHEQIGDVYLHSYMQKTYFIHLSIRSTEYTSIQTWLLCLWRGVESWVRHGLNLKRSNKARVYLTMVVLIVYTWDVARIFSARRPVTHVNRGAPGGTGVFSILSETYPHCLRLQTNVTWTDNHFSYVEDVMFVNRLAN